MQLGFLSLGIASAIATAAMVKVVHAVNKYGNDIGIAATKGTTFLGLTWGATAAMLLAACLSTIQCIAGRKNRRTYGEKGYH
jgi:phosphoribosylformylglycinamidine (FGAM) synthase-like enzyme